MTKKKEYSTEVTDYQLQVMQIVMEVWEQKMLQYKNWNNCWPNLLSDGKVIKGRVKVILVTGADFTDADIKKFKELCIARFGSDCNPAKGKVVTRKENNLRYLVWYEPYQIWPWLKEKENGCSLNCKWYYEYTGKEWPADFLEYGHLMIGDWEYRAFFDKGPEFLCALNDGVIRIFKGHPYVPVWWNSVDGLDKMPVKVKAKKDIVGDDGTIIHEGEIVTAAQGRRSILEDDLTASDGRCIKNVDHNCFEILGNSV